jgi:5-methylcytosine-specific restriction protein A
VNWCIYVGSKASQNFEIGKQSLTWGHKTIFEGCEIADLKVGDRLFFCHYIRQIVSYDLPTKSGFPRVPVQEMFGVVQEITEVEITKPLYFDDITSIWPDDIYPHRFQFKILTTVKNVEFGPDVVSPAFLTAFHWSIMRKGLPAKFAPSSNHVIYNEMEEDMYEANEGKLVTRVHFARERDPKVVKLKKESVLKQNGKLCCEACGFDFQKVYGDRGKDFIECHHENPLALTLGVSKTTINDLILLCSNCHRIVHRNKPWLKFEQLIERLQNRGYSFEQS